MIEKERKTMWSLISDRRSNQQQARQSFSQTESEQMSFEMTSFTSSKSSSHFHPRLHETRFILLILATVLAIVTVFDAVFGLKLSDFNVCNVFCDDFEFELEYDCDTVDGICAAENTQASAFEFNDTSSGIRDFNINKRVFALVFNEYEFNNEITNMIDIYFNDNVLDSEYYFATSGMFIFDTFLFFVYDVLFDYPCTIMLFNVLYLFFIFIFIFSFS